LLKLQILKLPLLHRCLAKAGQTVDQIGLKSLLYCKKGKATIATDAQTRKKTH